VSLPPLPPPGLVTTEPRGLEVGRAHTPGQQGPGPAGPPESPASSAAAHQPPPFPFSTPPPMPAVGGGAFPPVPDESLLLEAQAEIVTAPRELPRSMVSRAAQGDPGGAAGRPTEPLLALVPDGVPARTEAGRRGLDDTHPSYQMAPAKPPEDTQPRVVLDEAALQSQSDTGEIIITGVPEESSISNPGRASSASEDSISVPGRSKSTRRVRGSSSSGMPAVPRGGAAPARGAPRPVGPESSEAEDSVPVSIDVDDAGVEPRNPRDETRRTPLPSKPGEGSRRAQREEPRRPATPAPAQKRSWGWFAVSLVLLLGAGAAVYVTLPQMEKLLKSKLGIDKPPELGLTPIQPQVPPSGPPGTAPPPAPSATPPLPAGAAAAPPSAPEPAGKPPQATAAAGSAVTPESADEDLVVPVPTPLAPPPKKAPGSRPGKRGSTTARSKEANELQKEWSQARSFYSKLTQEQSCDSPKLALACKRFEDLKGDMSGLGEGAYDKDVYNRAKKLRIELGNLVRNQ
jgi:hypothetical protein